MSWLCNGLAGIYDVNFRSRNYHVYLRMMNYHLAFRTRNYDVDYRTRNCNTSWIFKVCPNNGDVSCCACHMMMKFRYMKQRLNYACFVSPVHLLPKHLDIQPFIKYVKGNQNYTWPFLLFNCMELWNETQNQRTFTSRLQRMHVGGMSFWGTTILLMIVLILSSVGCAVSRWWYVFPMIIFVSHLL